MKVADIMNKDLCVAHVEATVAEAATLMGERRVGSVVVLEDGRLVGILTERDIVRALSTAHDAPTRPIIEWMSKDPTTVPSDTEVNAALRIMVDGGFRHLPVVDGDSPVGMISIRDVAGTMAT